MDAGGSVVHAGHEEGVDVLDNPIEVIPNIHCEGRGGGVPGDQDLNEAVLRSEAVGLVPRREHIVHPVES